MIKITWPCRGTYSWAYMRGATGRWRQLVGLPTDRFKRASGCLAGPRLSLVSTLLRTCPAALTRYASTDGRTGNEHGSLMHLRAGKSEERVWAKRQSVEEHHMHMKTGICKTSQGYNGNSTQMPHRIVHSTSERGYQVWSIHVGLPCVFRGPWSDWSAGRRLAKAAASSRATGQARPESHYPE